MELAKPKIKTKTRKKASLPSFPKHEDTSHNEHTSTLADESAKDTTSEIKSVSSAVSSCASEVTCSVTPNILVKDSTIDSPMLLSENIDAEAKEALKSVVYPQHLLSDELVLEAEGESKIKKSPAEKKDLTSNVENLQPLSTTTKNLYPVLKNIEPDVLSYHTVTEAFTSQFMVMTGSCANKAYMEFFQGISGISNHEFFELVLDFETSRRKLLDARDKTLSLQFSIKNKSEYLWDTNHKEVNAKGFCGDGKTVSVYGKYEIYELNQKIADDLEHKLLELENDALPNLSFLEYTVSIVQKKIELYLYYLVQSTDDTVKKQNSPSATFASLSSCVPKSETMRICISVLFYFQRKPTTDYEFITVTRQWLTDMVSRFLSVGSSADRLFILNHVLRCPGDIHSWATSFIQLPSVLSLDESVNNIFSDSPILQFILPSFLMILNQVHGREEFLKDIKTCDMHAESCPPDCSFAVLNYDGAEAEPKYMFTKDFCDADILGIFRQIPLFQILEQSSCFSSSDGNLSESNMQQVIAFSRFLLCVFEMGFKTYTPKKHSSVLRRVGNFMCSTVQYLSNQWRKFKVENMAYNFCLQVEVDRVVFHTVHTMINRKDIGILECLYDIPYDCVSPKMLWNLLWLFHTYTEDNEQTLFIEKDVENKLKDPTFRALLQEKFKSFNEDEAIAILKTLGKMALSKGSEEAYVCCITQEIFEVLCFAEKITQSMLNKAVALISKIATEKLVVVSFLLVYMRTSSDSVLKFAIELFNVLPLSKWVPEAGDMEIISEWLLSGSLASTQNQLSRIILKRLNWNFEDGKLFLPIELHRQVSILIVKAYLQYDGNGDNWLVSKGIKQMLHLYTPILFQDAENDKGFIAWAWQLLFSLKLHVLSNPNPPWINIFDGEVDLVDLPDVHHDSSLHALLSAYIKKHSAACYVVIAMTNIGHSLKYLTNEGLEIICTLIDFKQYAAAVQSLYFILPFFAKSQEIITTNHKFLTHLSDLITVDSTMCSNVGETVLGTVLCKIQEMIKIQLFQAWQLTVEYVNPLIKLWVDILVKLLILEDKGQLKLNSGANQVYCLLDLITKIAFLHPYMKNGLMDFLSHITRPLFQASEGQKQSFWGWLFETSIKVSPLLPRASSLHTWFAYTVILAEINQKVVQELWLDIQNLMVSESSLTAELAFKQTSSAMYQYSLNIHNLPIYRWASQALQTPVGHPLQPLIWQMFFCYYLQRATSISGTSQRSSIGYRFFTSGSYVRILKELKMKLKLTLDFYDKHAEVVQSESSVPESLNKVTEGCQNYRKPMNSRKELFLLYLAFSSWLDDSSLHGPIYLPALQPKYLPDKLKLILDNNQNPWLEYIDMDKIKQEVLPKEDLWISVESAHSAAQVNEEIIFASSEPPLDIPSVPIADPPIPEIQSNVLLSSKSLTRALNADQKVICSEAMKFEAELLRLKNLNNKYMSLISSKYRIEERKICFRKPCYLNSKCSAPASFKLTVPKVICDERISSHILHNRCDFQQALSGLTSPPSKELCTAAIHMEILVRKLVNEFKRGSQTSVSEQLRKVGIALFYDQLKKVEETLSSQKSSVPCYSPSKQFFATCVEILGNEFILGQEDQCPILLDTLLKKPAAALLASSYFLPHNVSVNTFLSIYDTLVKSMSLPNISPCAVFVLLSKVNVATWLCRNKPSFSFRTQLLQAIGRALNYCGCHPEPEKMPVYDIVKKHFFEVLMYEFPDLYADAVCIILNGAEMNTMSVDVWYELFRYLGCHIEHTETKIEEIKIAVSTFAMNRMLTPDQKLFISSPPLQFDQIISSLDYFHNYFMRARRSSPGTLYKKYKIYLKPITVYLGMMGHSLLELASDEHLFSKNQSSKLSSLWNILHCAFKAWIDPCVDSSGKGLEFPWSPDEEAEALKMMEMFASCIEFHHVRFRDENCDNTILSYAWNYYVITYVKNGFRNYSITVFHTAFYAMPWNTFHPSDNDIEMMYEIFERGYPESWAFISEIIMKIPWLTTISKLTATLPHDTVKHALNCLAKLLIRCGWEFSIVKVEKNYRKLLKSLEGLPWQHLELPCVHQIMDVYADLCNPKILLCSSSRSFPDACVLSFLKVVAGLIPKSQMTPSVYEEPVSQVEQKRCMFLQKVMTLIGVYVSHNSSDREYADNLCLFVSSYLKDIDSVVSKDFSCSEQITMAIPLVKEVLIILNFIVDNEMQQKVLNFILEWISSNPRTPLLLPCIKVSCTSLVNISSFVAIVECCINARYNTELQDPAEASEIWHLISSCFQIPSAKDDEFLEACIEQCACLCLYEYVLHRMCSSNSPKKRVFLFGRMLFWVQKIKPTEACETKLILLWDKVLDVSLKVAADNDILVVENGLKKFCSTLSVLSEDRFLPFRFLNKTSDTSVNFRFLCRALSAYVLLQMPENGSLRLDPCAGGCASSIDPERKSMKYSGDPSTPHVSKCSVKALEELKCLLNKQSYAALKSQIDKALNYIYDPRFCFREARELLKELAVQVFPNQSFLHLLCS